MLGHVSSSIHVRSVPKSVQRAFSTKPYMKRETYLYWQGDKCSHNARLSIRTTRRVTQEQAIRIAIRASSASTRWREGRKVALVEEFWLGGEEERSPSSRSKPEEKKEDIKMQVVTPQAAPHVAVDNQVNITHWQYLTAFCEELSTTIDIVKNLRWDFLRKRKRNS